MDTRTPADKDQYDMIVDASLKARDPSTPWQDIYLEKNGRSAPQMLKMLMIETDEL